MNTGLIGWLFVHKCHQMTLRSIILYVCVYLTMIDVVSLRLTCVIYSKMNTCLIPMVSLSSSSYSLMTPLMSSCLDSACVIGSFPLLQSLVVSTGEWTSAVLSLFVCLRSLVVCVNYSNTLSIQPNQQLVIIDLRLMPSSSTTLLLDSCVFTDDDFHMRDISVDSERIMITDGSQYRYDASPPPFKMLCQLFVRCDALSSLPSTLTSLTITESCSRRDRFDVDGRYLDVTSSSVSLTLALRYLVHLRCLRLKHILDDSLTSYAFRDMSDLEELDLSDSQFVGLDCYFFRYVTGLRRLYLHRTVIIKCFQPSSFKYLTHLTTLDITDYSGHFELLSCVHTYLPSLCALAVSYVSPHMYSHYYCNHPMPSFYNSSAVQHTDVYGGRLSQLREVHGLDLYGAFRLPSLIELTLYDIDSRGLVDSVFASLTSL